MASNPECELITQSYKHCHTDLQQVCYYWNIWPRNTHAADWVLTSVAKFRPISVWEAWKRSCIPTKTLFKQVKNEVAYQDGSNSSCCNHRYFSPWSSGRFPFLNNIVCYDASAVIFRLSPRKDDRMLVNITACKRPQTSTWYIWNLQKCQLH